VLLGFNVTSKVEQSLSRRLYNFRLAHTVVHSVIFNIPVETLCKSSPRLESALWTYDRIVKVDAGTATSESPSIVQTWTSEQVLNVLIQKNNCRGTAITSTVGWGSLITDTHSSSSRLVEFKRWNKTLDRCLSGISVGISADEVFNYTNCSTLHGYLRLCRKY